MTSSSGSVALPLRLTLEPSWTVWAGPASTDGRLLTCAVTVMITESEDVAVSSSAVSVKMMAVSESTRGAVKVVDAEVALASVMSDEVELWVHR